MDAKRPNPTATLIVGPWHVHMETRRTGFRTEREVRSSDTGDCGKGTLLRTEKRFCRMTIHTVRLINPNTGDRFTVQVNEQVSRTSVTRTLERGLRDIDDKPIADKPESLGMDKASAWLSRFLGLDADVVAKAILAPFPPEEEQAPAAKPVEQHQFHTVGAA